jgi:hypothetical protein
LLIFEKEMLKNKAVTTPIDEADAKIFYLNLRIE